MNESDKEHYWWNAKPKTGRPKKFATPEDLWAAAQDYFAWVEENPLEEEKVFVHQGQVTRVKVYKKRAMLMCAMRRFIGLSNPGWVVYTQREDYTDTCAAIRDVIYQQKLEGGMADLLNPNLVARELGLADKKELETGPLTVQLVDYSDVSSD